MTWGVFVVFVSVSEMVTNNMQYEYKLYFWLDVKVKSLRLFSSYSFLEKISIFREG